MLAAQSSNPLSALLLPAIFVAMYFLILRPQQQRAKAQREVTKAIDEGDEVMTGSGMYGYVTAIEGDVVWLEIADGVDIRVARAAISKKITAAAAVDDAGQHDDTGHGEPDSGTTTDGSSASDSTS
jgi:preprotein translocase YajC subunit